jgi:hypothetical protein
MKKTFIVPFFILFGIVFFGFVARADTFNSDLYYGIRGNTDVSQLQEFLTTQGLYSGPVSGNFFSLTLAAVEQFQTSQNITPAAGYFGPVTRVKANAIIDQQIQASNSQALIETSSTPPTSTTTSNGGSPLQAQLNALMQELALLEGQVQTQQSTTTPATTQPTTIQPVVTNAWSTFQSVVFNIFQANPNAYLNQNVVLNGLFDGTFLPSNNGTPNYIEIQDPSVVSPPVEIAIASQSNYTLAVNALSGKYEPIVRVYGTGATMQDFTMTNGTSKMIPVITAQRIDMCNYGAPTCSLGTTSIFPTGLSTPSTITQPTPTSPTPTPTPPTPTPTPTSTPSATQCNFNGNVFSCTSSSQISASPTSLPNAIVGASYNQPIKVNDSNISSQNLRWNIISGSLPAGMAFVFSPSQALECSGTYCFFTAPPSGASYSSGNAAYLFGTPTTAGIYSFTLQAIDSLNDFNLLTFTINIASPTVTVATTTTPTPTSSVPKSSADAMSSFSVAGVTENLCGNCQNFTVKVPLGTNLTSLTPDIAISAGATVSPASGIAQNFANPVTYTVTAQNGVTSQTYVATVTPVPDTDGILRNLTVNGNTVSGFGGNTYSYNITLPASTTAIPTVAAAPDSSLSTVVITQATGLPGTATVVVTAQDGITTETYTVNFVLSGTAQCNVNGSVFSCTQDNNISFSPTSLPNGTSGASYGEPLTVSDPHTSSQSFRWNIISGALPPGVGIAFSPSQAIECAGTYCYFTTPPGGLTYPANAPGYFFGTPTVAGAYSFTLQAIDSLNYFAVPTFSVTVN